MPLHINTQVLLFADDTTLLAATDYNDINELNEKLSLEVSSVQNWAITNKPQLNTTKTKTILISGKRLKAKLTPENQTLNIKLNDDLLEQEHTVKLLGFNIDESDDLNTTEQHFHTSLNGVFSFSMSCFVLETLRFFETCKLGVSDVIYSRIINYIYQMVNISVNSGQKIFHTLHDYNNLVASHHYSYSCCNINGFGIKAFKL